MMAGSTLDLRKSPDPWAVIREFVALLKNGEAVEFRSQDGDLVAEKFSFAELAPRLERPGIVALLGQMARPGVMYLQRYLELKHFEPFSDRNALLECYVLRWAWLDWSLTMFPVDSLSPYVARHAIGLAGLVAKACVPIAQFNDQPPLTDGTRPTPTPSLFARGCVEMDLPLQYARLLENQPGHLVYTDPAAAHAIEKEKLERIEVEWLAGR